MQIWMQFNYQQAPALIRMQHFTAVAAQGGVSLKYFILLQFNSPEVPNLL